MKFSKLLVGMLAAASFASAQAATVDTIQYPNGFFVDVDANKYDAPYYNYQSSWGWTHNAIGGPITTATLNISAFDVDFDSGEVDNIYALDSGTWTLLGSLGGANDVWAFTNFNLGANFFDDIAAGLQVRMDIDVNSGGWAVTLAKSVLSIDGGVLPPAPPIPEPETYAMLLAGLGLMGAVARRRKAKQQ